MIRDGRQCALRLARLSRRRGTRSTRKTRPWSRPSTWLGRSRKTRSKGSPGRACRAGAAGTKISTQLLRQRARRAIESDDYDEALAILDCPDLGDEDRSALHLRLGIQAANEGRFEPAETHLSRAAQFNPGELFIRGQLAELYWVWASSLAAQARACFQELEGSAAIFLAQERVQFGNVRPAAEQHFRQARQKLERAGALAPGQNEGEKQLVMKTSVTVEKTREMLARWRDPLQAVLAGPDRGLVRRSRTMNDGITRIFSGSSAPVPKGTKRGRSPRGWPRRSISGSASNRPTMGASRRPRRNLEQAARLDPAGQHRRISGRNPSGAGTGVRAMTAGQERNPFEILRLDAEASIQEAIERGRELAEETMDRELQARYRRAVEEICQHPVRRACNQFWEPPGACYEDETLEDFCRRNRRPPVTAAALEERSRRVSWRRTARRGGWFACFCPRFPLGLYRGRPARRGHREFIGLGAGGLGDI